MTKYILLLLFSSQLGLAQIIKFDVRAKYSVSNGECEFEKIGFASSTNDNYIMKMGATIAQNQIAIVTDVKNQQNHEFSISSSDVALPTFKYVGSYKIRKDETHKIKLDEENIIYNGELQTVHLTLTPKRASKYCTNMELVVVKAPVNLIPLYLNLFVSETFVPSANKDLAGAVYNVTIEKSNVVHNLVALEETSLILNIPAKLTTISLKNATTTLQPYRVEIINNKIFYKEDKRGAQKFGVKGVDIRTQRN